MVKKIILLLVFSLLFVTSSQGQKLKRYDDILLFKEAQSKQPIIIINDSLVYKGKQLIPFKHTDYPDKISEYLPFEIGTKTYLVHQGCGPVLEFRNDSIVRIDHSFLQKNQYYPVPFTYNNEMYLLGGYGLFTYKNIITRFDFKSGEWNQVQTRGNILPEPRAVAYSLQYKNTLYVFGGKTNDNNNIPKFKAVQPELWKLDLPTMTWTYLGQYNTKALTEFEEKIQYQDKLYLLEGFITEIDFTQKTATKFSFKGYEELRKHFVIGDTIYGIFSSSDNKLYFKKTTIADLKGKLIGTVPFFIAPKTNPINYPTMGLIGVTIFGLLVIGYKKRIIPFQKPFNGIVYNGNKNEFSYKRKVISHFEENEKKILYFLLKHPNLYVSLNTLNELFENTKQTETLTAVMKRRELAVNGLVAKVALITEMPESNLILERKNTEDKRLKDVLLLPNLLVEI
jgi:hypothetical protein